MSKWVPLWEGLLDSTVWTESKEVKILWITMLAAMDFDGNILMPLPGLARKAVLTNEECEGALKRLMEPDGYSQTKAHGGRRVLAVDGGWHVVSHQKYRDKIKKEYRKAYQRRKQAEYRDKKKSPQPYKTLEEKLKERE